MRKILFSLFIILLTGYSALAQSATPTVTNAGGGSYNDPNSYYRYFEWSIGELTLINTVASADSSVVVYQGVLQPCTDKPGFSVFEDVFAPGDFKLFPNPTTGQFEINFFIRESGMLTLEMTDVSGKTLEKRSFRYYGCCRVEHYDISNLPAGVYFVIATLTPDPYSNFNIRQVTRSSGLRVVKFR
jgi:Secretion system C-terminal sorting domain